MRIVYEYLPFSKMNIYYTDFVFEYTPEYSKQLNYTFDDFEEFIKSVDYYVVKKIDYYNYLIKPK